MGYSSYFEVWPSALAETLQKDEGCWAAFRRLWGVAGGMHYWFTQLGEAELEDICHGIPSASVDDLRRLLAASPNYPNTFLYKSHSIHDVILTALFSAQRVEEPVKLARAAIFGAEQWDCSTGFRLVTVAIVREIAELLGRADLRAAVNAFNLEDQAPREGWIEDLTGELEMMAEMYGAAARDGHPVITGDP